MIGLWTPTVEKINKALGGQMRLVGGCVRDYLLGKEPDDIDIATPIEPKKVLEALKQQQIKARPVALAHGVVAATVDGQTFEITTLRQEDYVGSGQEKITFIADYKKDALRRDFTINAMSMDRDGQIYDYFGGQADLKAKNVRFIGQPEKRLWEDPLRIYRYVRFWAAYGGKEPDSSVVALFDEAKRNLKRVSKMRCRKEISKILKGARAADAADLLDKFGILPIATKNIIDTNLNGRII